MYYYDYEDGNEKENKEELEKQRNLYLALAMYAAFGNRF